jgi:phospholipid N-methyltransferase
MEDYKRLHAADIHTPQELRCALRELVPHLRKKKEDDPVCVAEAKLVGRKIPGFFPTPKPVVSRMLQLIDIQPGERVLEPSAGKGDILDMLREHHPDAEVTAIEVNGEVLDVLQAKGHDAEHGDFLYHQAPYDAVIMNPPFENGQEIDHLRHAHRLLVPGGRLVSVMSAGPFFREDTKAKEFRDWLEKHEHEVEDLPEDAFRGIEAFRQTGVRTKLVFVRKVLS